MKNFLEKILCDPSDKSMLTKNIEDNSFISNNEQKYKLINDLPDLRPNNYKAIEVASQLHLDFGTDFVYHQHYELDAKINDYFEEYTCSATTDEFRRIHQAIISKVPNDTDLILDVGCGSAWVAEYFLQKGKKVISMDISESNPKKAIEKFPSPNHSGLIADVFHLPIKDNSLDCIIASEIIEHVINPKEFINELLRALKPKGKLIITTPYNEKLEYQLCVHCNKPTTKHAHLHSFNEDNIKDILPVNSKYNHLIFGNKYLGRLRTNYFLGFLPFNLWRVFDQLATLIINKPIRFLIEITK
ncbi:methyltransferase domain-containing protein [Candidatus Kapabacteria bacterium]|nr:methyltransferase domain-containing protein [Candidatus Kapabacteria bacterium]